MATSPLVVAGLAGGAVLLARVPTLARGSGRRGPPPGAAEEAEGHGRPTVSVVVPARNEAAALPALLASLQRLSPAPREIIVVDDGSDDGTARVAAERGAEVRRVAGPPPGWLGKPWACQVGAEAASGTHLWFLDADTWVAPGALGRLVAEHRRHGGLVSVQPYHVTERPYEQLSAIFNVVAAMGSGAFAPWRRRAASPAAFGPCLFTSADDYRAAGAHRAVRQAVVEDLALARRYRRAGLPVSTLAGGSLVRFRMYPDGLRQLVEGWSKNVALGAATADRVAVAGAIAWVASCAAVAVTGMRAAARRLAGSPGPPAGAAAAWLAVTAELWWMLRRLGSFRWWVAPAFPVPLAAFLGIFARSAVRSVVHGDVTWRGRRVPLRPTVR